MTDIFSSDADEDSEPSEPSVPDWPNISYEVLNPDHTVGVACGRDGTVIGLLLTDDARDNGDIWLAAEIVRLARLAYHKSRVGLRTEMAYNGTRPHTLDSFGLPTEAEYNAMENAEFSRPAG